MKRIILVILTGLFVIINTNHLQISKSIKITPKYRSVGIEYIENNYFPIEDKKVEAKIRWLALNIYYEARSENELGQRAVAWVVLNRVQSIWWPNTIKEVITQKHQFSWYYKGKEKKTPKDKESWRKAQQIARIVYKNYINGKLDPTNGADHYHASYVTPNWAKSTKQTIRVGKHLFYDLFKEPQK